MWIITCVHVMFCKLVLVFGKIVMRSNCVLMKRMFCCHNFCKIWPKKIERQQVFFSRSGCFLDFFRENVWKVFFGRTAKMFSPQIQICIRFKMCLTRLGRMFVIPSN